MEWKDEPDSEGHWILRNEHSVLGEETGFDVYLKPHSFFGAEENLFWFATSDYQTDPCIWLTGKWKKISDEFQSRMRGRIEPEPVESIQKRFKEAKEARQAT